jgi:hypothetical protein
MAGLKNLVDKAVAAAVKKFTAQKLPADELAAVPMTYPQFACANARIVMSKKGGAFNGVFCAGNDATFIFQD